jgi:cytochrome c biogenesis protein CcmG/thiol:disulfide interchange protein DsbE
MLTANIRACKTTGLRLCVICAMLTLACAPQESNSSNATPVLSVRPNTTYPMPPFRSDTAGADMGWTLLEGNRVTLADFHGKVLVLDFYATWCGPCRKSIPHLNEMEKRIGTQDLQIVGLNVGGPDDRIRVAGFAKELEIGYPLGFPDKSLTDLFLSDNDSIPQTFVFDRSGQLVKRFIGYDDSMPGQLETAIQSALTSGSNKDN